MDEDDDSLMASYVSAFLAFSPNVGPCSVTLDDEGFFVIVWGTDNRTISKLYRDDLIKMRDDLVRETREKKDTVAWLIN